MEFLFWGKRYNILDSQMFNGAIDWHCHILPEVDDGIGSLQDAIAVLKYYEQIGIKEVWLTPHIIEDIPNTTQGLRSQYEKLCEEYQGNVILHLSAENMLDELFMKRLEANDVLPIGSNADHLLIEFSFMQPPAQLYASIRKILEKGYIPILAHPERYSYMSIKDLEAIRQMGCKLQLNITSLAEAYGKHAKERAQRMLMMGLYDICGSDLHSLDSFQHSITSKVIKKEFIDKLSMLSQML